MLSLLQLKGSIYHPGFWNFSLRSFWLCANCLNTLFLYFAILGTINAGVELIILHLTQMIPAKGNYLPTSIQKWKKPGINQFYPMACLIGNVIYFLHSPHHDNDGGQCVYIFFIRDCSIMYRCISALGTFYTRPFLNARSLFSPLPLSAFNSL